MLYYHQALFMPRVLAVRAQIGLGNGYSFGNDFYQVWLASREWLRTGRDVYSPDMTREIQTGLYGRPLDPRILTDPIDRRVFPYPAFTVLLFWPAAEYPFTTVRVVAVCALGVLTFASVLLWLRALAWRLRWSEISAVLLLTLCSYPVLEGLFAGQLGLLVGFLLAASILAVRRGRLRFAGVLMALTTIKPQVTALVIFYLLLWSFHDWRARGRYCVGLFSALALVLGTSLAVRPNWIQSWTHTVLAYHQYTRPPLITEVLAAPLGARAAGPATFVLFVGLMIAAVALAWRHRAAAADSLEFWLTFSLLLAITSVTLLPGQAVYDHVILLPGILLVLHYWRELLSSGRVPRTLLTPGAIVLFLPWVAAFALLVVRPFLAPQHFFATAIFSLPIRNAASLPFAVLALLVCVWRISSDGNRELA